MILDPLERLKLKRILRGEGKPEEQPHYNETEVERNDRLHKMFSPERLKIIKAKELRKYAEALDKKWKNWFSSVSK